MPYNRLSDIFQYERDPLNPLDRVLALQDPHSDEYKSLIDFIQADLDKRELCAQLMIHLLQSRTEEERVFARRQEAKFLKQEEQEKREAAVKLNDEIRAECLEAKAKIEARTPRKQPDPALEIKILTEMKSEVEEDLAVKNEEIRQLETTWKYELKQSANKFINDNFSNENGKLVSKKNPQIELQVGADNVIQKIYQDAKSPADMVKFNPNLKDNPEHMMIVDDVRKEIRMAKKIDKIVAEDVRVEANKKRVIVEKRVMKDDEGNLIYEKDASGKMKVKTETFIREPETKQLRDAQATDESTMKKVKEIDKKLACLNDVCFLRDEVIANPVTHTSEQTEAAKKLLVAGQERNELQAKVKALDENIKSAEKSLAGKQVEISQQYRIEAEASTSAKPTNIPEAPPPPPPYRPKK